MRIADLSIRRPVFATMLTATLVVLGWISLGRLGVDLFPRVELPYVVVTTVLEGATPETVETEVSDVIEEHVNTISGISELRSVSSEGLSRILVQFELEEDVEAKTQDVRDKVARARLHLPIEAESPLVEKVDPDADPILSVMVSGDLSIGELTRFADAVVKERLQRIPGVGSATLVGGRDREVRIWIDGNQLRSHSLTVEDVIRAIRSEHVDIPGGRLEGLEGQTEFSVKTKGEVSAVREFGDIVVAYRTGAPTLIRDVARVEDGLEDERTYAALDGIRGVSLEVRRQSGRNTVEVARAVKAELGEIQAHAPPGVRVIVARDLSRFIESSARDVAVDMVIGGFLAVLVTLLFLRSIRTTLIVSIAIPASIISTFFLFWLMDFTINMLTLMALSVSIGLLIDDAIVVLESIHRRIEAGDEPKAAASRGTTEVGTAVVAGTISVLAVFIPIAFITGLIGRFFHEYGLAIAFAVAVSLLVAVTATPMFCSRVLRRETSRGRIFLTLERLYSSLEGGYRLALGAALRHRLLVVVLAGGSIYLGISFARDIPLDFDSKVDRSECTAFFELPPGVGIEATKAVGRRVATAIAAVPHVEHVFLTVGGGSKRRVNEANLYLRLSPKSERDIGQWEIMAAVRRAMLPAAPEAKRVGVNAIFWISAGGLASYDAEFSVDGPELAVLEEVAGRIVAGLRGSPLFVDSASSYQKGKPEVQILVDRRRVADLAVPIRSLATTVRALVGGMDVATYEESGSRYDVRVRLEESQRNDLDRLGRIQVRSASGRLVDLANLARVRVESGPAQIERKDRSRKVTVFTNTSADVALGTAIAELSRIVDSIGLPPGYHGKLQGKAEKMQESVEAVRLAFVLALLALYIVLAIQFDSYLQPVVIMLTAPLSFVGAFAALWIASSQLSIFAQIGVIALMGLVMKNGILLVDYANQQRADGASAREAILEAGPVRLRPVLMTAFSTIFGMVPVAFSTTDAAEWRNPMGLLVIGGLLSSTFLTLLVVPVAYSIVDDLRELPGRIRSRVSRWRPIQATPIASEATTKPGVGKTA